MRRAQEQLSGLLEKEEITAGMYVRVRGDHLIAGRLEPVGPEGGLEETDRVRFTHLGATSYGLSVKRHTGRWEKTPFSGTMKDMVEIVWGIMQHLVTPYP